MTDTFVPLFAPDGSPTSKVAAPFQPAMTAPAANFPSPLTAAPAANHQPVVSLIHADGRVSHIRITCACGQVIELACEY